jgi:hypothetical protein
LQLARQPDNAPISHCMYLKVDFQMVLVLVYIHVFLSVKTAELSQSTGLIPDGSEFVSLIQTLSVIYANIWLWDLTNVQQN